MTKRIYKSTACGVVAAPPSKSYAHRLLIGSALTNQKCSIKNIELSDDINATISCLNELGVQTKYINSQIILEKKLEKLNDQLIFNCNESGSTLRFFIPIALLTGKKLEFRGTPRLMSRGLSVYEEIFKQDNIKYHQTETSLFLEGKLQGGHYQVMGNISSQFITGLLFSLPLLSKDSTIEIIPPIESLSYINITIDVLKTFGVNVKQENNLIRIVGNQSYQPQDIVVEGDYSNAAFLDAFNYLGGNVKVEGLNQDSLQGDRVYHQYFDLLDKSYVKLDIANCIDLGPILFTIAAFKHGAHFIGTKRLTIKESNRVLDVLNELKKFGAKFKVFDNEVYIYEAKLFKPKEVLSSHNDHRIVMSLCVLLSYFGGTIANTEAVNKSFPTFFSVIRQLGIEVCDEI